MKEVLSAFVLGIFILLASFQIDIDVIIKNNEVTEVEND